MTEKATLTFRLGTLLWLERHKQNKKCKPVAHKAKITVVRLEEIERGKGPVSIDTYARVASALNLPLWELVKQCEEFKVPCNLYKLAAMRRKLKEERNLT
jgi:transcriptional regulator with XRE-family HTH domain